MSEPTEAQKKRADEIIEELIFEETILKAARSFQFGNFKADFCGFDGAKDRFRVIHIFHTSERFLLDGTTEYEMQPSNRTPEFIAKTAFERDTAIRLAMRLDKEEKEQLNERARREG